MFSSSLCVGRMIERSKGDNKQSSSMIALDFTQNEQQDKTGLCMIHRKKRRSSSKRGNSSESLDVREVQDDLALKKKRVWFLC